MNNLQTNQNTLNLILTSLIFLGSFFFQSSVISFKIIYAFQVLIIFYFFIKYSGIKIDKQIVILNLAVLSLIFFKFDKSYIYLILICFLNTIFTFDKINRINLKYNLILQLVFTIIMILCFKTTTIQNNIITEWFLFDEIKNNYESYKACLIANENAILNNIPRFENCEFQLKRLRYRFLDLHSNLTAIFCLIITYILLKDLKKKKFIFLYSTFGLFFLYMTLSKSGLLFFLTILCLTFLNLNNKILLLLFFVFNFFLGIISYNFSSSVSNFWGKDTSAAQNVYEQEFCPKIKNIPVIGYFNECNVEKNEYIQKMNENPQLLLFNIMGYSTFYKLHSYGMVTESVLNNLRYYLFPNPLYQLEKNKIIDKKDINGKLSSHGLFFLVFLKYGIILGTIFFINLYLFLKKISEKKLFIAFIFSSTFLSLDIFLLFPYFLLSMLIKSRYK